MHLHTWNTMLPDPAGRSLKMIDGSIHFAEKNPSVLLSKDSKNITFFLSIYYVFGHEICMIKYAKIARTYLFTFRFCTKIWSCITVNVQRWSAWYELRWYTRYACGSGGLKSSFMYTTDEFIIKKRAYTLCKKSV